MTKTNVNVLFLWRVECQILSLERWEYDSVSILQCPHPVQHHIPTEIHKAINSIPNPDILQMDNNY